MEPRLYT